MWEMQLHSTANMKPKQMTLVGKRHLTTGEGYVNTITSTDAVLQNLDMIQYHPAFSGSNTLAVVICWYSVSIGDRWN